MPEKIFGEDGVLPPCASVGAEGSKLVGYRKDIRLRLRLQPPDRFQCLSGSDPVSSVQVGFSEASDPSRGKISTYILSRMPNSEALAEVAPCGGFALFPRGRGIETQIRLGCRRNGSAPLGACLDLERVCHTCLRDREIFTYVCVDV